MTSTLRFSAVLASTLALALAVSGCGPGSGKTPSAPQGASAGSTAAGTTGSTGTPTATASGSAVPSAPALQAIDDLQVYASVGDSLAAGLSAPANESYCELLRKNDDAAYPNYAGQDLESFHPGAAFVWEATPGDTSTDIANTVASVLPSWPDTTPGGDALVVVSMGGNDVLNDLSALANRARTRAIADRIRRNWQRLIDLLKAKYEDPAQGRRLVVVGLNLYDPTDGHGSFPAAVTQGQTVCAWWNQLPTTDRREAVDNFNSINVAIRDVLQRNQAFLADAHSFFLGHSPWTRDNWFAPDCVHANTRGHHQLRRLVWQVLTGTLR